MTHKALSQIGLSVRLWLASLGFGARLLLRLFTLLPTVLRRYTLLRDQIHFLGNYSLAIIGVSGLFVGFVLALQGYYILNQGLLSKLFHTALILAFLVLMVPHQVLAQAFIMQHLSVLFMPVLYICFGAVFDALVFVALYSWAVSKAPMDATV